MIDKSVEQFRTVLTQVTGLYFTNDRAQYLLDRIAKEATDLMYYLDGLTNTDGEQVDNVNLKKQLNHGSRK